MNGFMQTFFFSDLLVVMVPGIAILAVTAWAYSRREYAGYILGWLTGLFFIVALSSLFPPVTTTPGEVVTRQFVPLTVVIMATFLGLILSIGPTLAIFMTPFLQDRELSLLVALAMSAVIGGSYAMIMVTPGMRLAVAIFILAYAIGISTLLMISNRYGTEQVAAPPTVAQAEAAANDVLGAPTQIPAAAANTLERFQQIRERFAKNRTSTSGY